MHGSVNVSTRRCVETERAFALQMLSQRGEEFLRRGQIEHRG